MPYASHIQLVNDPNGTAYAFLADNGAIWQCQWDAQAGGWVKGQVVPQAFGGEKLQALYLDNLWPTGGESNPGFNPGIVLAYRLGEGSSAEIWASFGTWANDGTLQWLAPQQLTKDQVDDQTFSLVEGDAGVFDLVVQKKEAGAGSSTTLDKQNAASVADLQAKLEAEVSGARPDGDLYVNQYKLQWATNSTTAVVLNDITAGQLSAAIQSAVIQTAKAAAPLALSGDTQLSRQQLIQPLPTATTAALGNAVGSADTSGTSWNAASIKTSRGGTLRVGLMVDNILRWELNIPANYYAKVGNPLVDISLDDSQITEDLVNEYSPTGKPLILGNRVATSSDIEKEFDQISNGGLGRKSIRDAELMESLLTFNSDFTDLDIFQRFFSNSDNGIIIGAGLNLKWRGAFGIGNYGNGGLTSASTAKIIIGYGDEDAASTAVWASKFNNNLRAQTYNIGGGGSTQTLYQYSNRLF